MKVNSTRNFSSHLFSSLISIIFLLSILVGPVKADALLGVISFHIVPMQLENSQETKEEESSADEADESKETTVAQSHWRKRIIDVRAVAFNRPQNKDTASLEM